jgi:hypothetical protein
MDAVKLMNRIDTKFVLNIELLPDILQRIHTAYRILEIDEKKGFSYRSLYYDTTCDAMYLAHHNGKLNRFKVRFRKYLVNDLCFLEIKYKIKGTRTIKFRTPAPVFETNLSDDSIQYINKFTPFKDYTLQPKIYTNFSRITLVSNALNERITIDLDLNFQLNGSDKDLERIAIIEVKRDASVQRSDFISTLSHFRIFPQGFSKYCIGRAMLEEDLKSNNFKERILKINKINNGKYN